MKIFALNLCLEFLPLTASIKGKVSLISFDEMMNYLFKGVIPEEKNFYVKGEDTDQFLNEILDLQANELWRDLDFTVSFLFDNHSKVDTFLERFRDAFSNVDAAGGIVSNEKGEILVILHRGRWSLPKGGVEWLENPKEAAVREVLEETGIKELDLSEFFDYTYHTFRKNRKWLFKKTYWFLMKADSQQPLIPQQEENITDIRWVNPEEWEKITSGAYPQINDLLEKAFAINSAMKS